jgi:hypothetical protein
MRDRQPSEQLQKLRDLFGDVLRRETEMLEENAARG